MLEFLMPHSAEDAINVIKADHDKVKDIFNQFEKSNNRREKMKLAAEALRDLKIHAEIEEKIFYPTVRRHLENKLMNEADEEHHERAEEHAVRLRVAGEQRCEDVVEAGDGERDGEPAEHRDPADVRRRHLVHAARIGLDDPPEPPRREADDRGEHERRHGGDEPEREVCRGRRHQWSVRRLVASSPRNPK